MNNSNIINIQLPEEKSSICERILSSLPDWFGIPESITEYTRQVKELPFWGYAINDQIVGFVALEQYNSQIAEVIVMGILPWDLNHKW